MSCSLSRLGRFTGYSSTWKQIHGAMGMPDMPLFKGGAILKLSCEAKIFSCCHNLHRFFQSEVLRLYFPALEPWGAQSLSLPSGSSQFIHRQMWDHLLRQPPPPAPVLKLPPCHVSTPPQLPSPPILVVWVNVPSLTPWLSDFYTVLFSGSSDCFLFSNLLLSFFWLCKEVQCIYLHFHFGQESSNSFSFLKESFPSVTSLLF